MSLRGAKRRGNPPPFGPIWDKSADNVMRLLLSMLSWPDGTKPEVREIDDELAIGRGRESGWMLPDPASQLSRRHCLLTPFGDGWRVTDLSLNGTFVNESTTPLGR